MAAGTVSILLLTRNAGEIFPRVLESLFSCRGIDGAEVVMVDSGSRDGTVEAARRYPIRVHSIPAEEFSHGGTRNLAARRCSGEILVFLVQDAIPAAEDFLERLTAPLADHRVAAVYARQVARAEADPVEALYLASTYPERPHTLSAAGQEPRRIESMFFSNVAAAIRRSVWERFPFDATLIMSEDQQWAKEVLRAGFAIVYEPRAVVRHSHQYGLCRVFQRNFDSGLSLVGIVGSSLAEMAGYELRHLGAGIGHFLRTRRPWQVVRFLLYETARSSGFLLGRHSRWLPRRLKRALSLHKGYWREGPSPSPPGSGPDP